MATTVGPITHIRMNEAELTRLLRSPTGPVGRDMARRGRNALRVARGRAPVSPTGSHGRAPGYLRRNIVLQLQLVDGAPAAEVATTARTPKGYPYGALQENRRHYLRSALAEAAR